MKAWEQQSQAFMSSLVLVVPGQPTKGSCTAKYITWQLEVMRQHSNRGVPTTRPRKWVKNNFMLCWTYLQWTQSFKRPSITFYLWYTQRSSYWRHLFIAPRNNVIMVRVSSLFSYHLQPIQPTNNKSGKRFFVWKNQSFTLAYLRHT